ncbi:26286_t:CDS:2, partial [Gigaspora margarita]
GKKERKLMNDTNISMPAIGIVANTRHLSLAGMQVYTNLLSPNLKTLACGHKYHVECLEEICQKCLPCLEFLKNGIQANVDQLLELQENITEEFISETNEDDDNVIIIGSNKDTVLDSLLQQLKELQQ